MAADEPVKFYQGKTLQELSLGALGLKLGDAPSLDALLGDKDPNELTERFRLGLESTALQLGSLGRAGVRSESAAGKNIAAAGGVKTQKQVIGSLGKTEASKALDAEKERKKTELEDLDRLRRSLRRSLAGRV